MLLSHGNDRVDIVLLEQLLRVESSERDNLVIDQQVTDEILHQTEERFVAEVALALRIVLLKLRQGIGVARDERTHFAENEALVRHGKEMRFFLHHFERVFVSIVDMEIEPIDDDSSADVEVRTREILGDLHGISRLIGLLHALTFEKSATFDTCAQAMM